MKQFLRGTAELIAVFILIFVTPAVIAAIVSFDYSVYFSFIHAPSYWAIMTIISIIICILYMGMYQDLDNEKA